jgi:ABC-type phosphate/phosphonate transport system substrate-binding protein
VRKVSTKTKKKMTKKIKILAAAIALLMMAASCSNDDAPAGQTAQLPITPRLALLQTKARGMPFRARRGAL